MTSLQLRAAYLAASRKPQNLEAFAVATMPKVIALIEHIETCDGSAYAWKELRRLAAECCPEPQVVKERNADRYDGRTK